MFNKKRNWTKISWSLIQVLQTVRVKTKQTPVVNLSSPVPV